MILRKAIVLTTGAGLLFAIAFLAATLRVSAAPLAQATPTAEHEDSHAEEEEHGHGERIEAGAASVRIVAPTEGLTISTNSIAVEVETTNWPLGEGNHWHLYVDGNEQGMSQGNSDTMMAHDLEPGEHTLEVVLSTEQHQELDAADLVTIRVAGVAEAATAPTTDNTPVLVGGMVVAVLAVAGVAYTFARRK
ncbi:MAG TPA: hypothetical protein VJG32_19445 [Anaerolineae bacterium]|nr:hypothetical protein [Anaerolineae bacterium]